ncbi:zinc-finger domain-containing protein [Roseitranquillus sediminis]|uniref:zinc-finger domain-containing protein n=1 Tax=Roseitranquillus sediminis TaxID=2809051 RepID=UPI001D0C91C0|nr:zinc-finger domain-containing protein [Roseitranquillus sediminis]MBM9593620.1 zinc-finger domain-containing protein [Roseitranquillus sediminis]
MAQITRGNEPRTTTHDAPESEVVSSWRVACDGGDGALGHPRVWLQIPEELGWVECGYCDKRYIHESAVTPGEAVQPADSHPGIPTRDEPNR